MNIGAAIKQIRLRNNLKQINFADKIGITQAYLSQVENGYKTPSLDLLKKMAHYFDTPLPVMFWFAVEESDIKESKRDIFKTLLPSIHALISSLL